MITLNTTLNKFVTDNYDKIVHLARKIIKSSDRHVYEELAHHALESFVKHERAEELIEKKEAMQFLSGIIYRNWYSKTSPWYKLYKKNGNEVELYPDVISDGGIDMWLNPGHFYNLWSNLDDEFKEYEKDLEHSIDGTSEHDLIESIQGIMEDMEADTVEQWYRVVLFKMWLKTPNFSELERVTHIPRTSISQAVKECKQYIKNRIEQWS